MAGEQVGGANCPSCGRYVGRYDVCPYCGARIKTRISIRVLFVLSLIISCVGIFFIYYAAKTSEAPTIYIQDVTGEMNYARVRIVGYAYTSSSYDDVQGRLYFSMVDENWTYNEEFKTYTIMVFAYAPTARDLVELGKAPVSGDKVEIVGTLRVRDSISLIINDPNDITIIRDEPENMTLEIISYNWKNLLGRAVRVIGWLVELDNYTTFITAGVKDYSYPDFTLSIYVPEIAMRWVGKIPEIFIGDKIEIVGNLWEYRGSPEIVPWNGSSIRIVEKLSPTNLSTILYNQDEYADQGRIVMVNATIVGYDASYNNKLKIQDSSISGSKSVVLWIDFGVWGELNETIKEKLNTFGTHILVIGTCKFYGTSFEIAVYDTSWILEIWE